MIWSGGHEVLSVAWSVFLSAYIMRERETPFRLPRFTEKRPRLEYYAVG